MNLSAVPSSRPSAEPSGDPDRRRDDETVADDRDLARHLFERLSALADDTPERRAVRQELIERHIPLAVFFARRYAGRGEPFNDIVQVACLGLVKAVDRFDPARGVAFSTFAAPTVLGEIRRHFRDRTWSVHVHRSLQVRTGEVERSARELSHRLGRSPTVAELAASMRLPEEQVLEAITCSAAYRATSLSTPLGSHGTLGDRLGSDDPAYEGVELHESLVAALAQLPSREQRILQLRFFGNMTQIEIAEHIGVSQMHVSRLLGRTLSRLRADLVGAS